MTKVIISGCNGKMGQVVATMVAATPDMEVVAGFDRNPVKRNHFPVYAAPLECPLDVDCIIDFSHPSALTELLSFCKEKHCGIVLATTGYTPEQLDQIDAAATEIPVFRSANFSLGINVLLALVKQATRVLGTSADIEIIEKHHNRKLDAPSGTALMLADAASEVLDEAPEYIFDRHSRNTPRKKQEIGISSLRGGTIVGEHEVVFAGTDEVLELRHTAYSRETFANGAVKAAAFLSRKQQAGMYNMEDLVSEVI